MKRTVSILLIMSLLLCFAACGEREGSDVTSSHSAEPSPAGMVTYQENAQGYVIPTAWAQDSINDGTWGYVTAQSGIPDGVWSMENGYFTCRRVDVEGGTDTLLKISITGEELCRLTIPRMEQTETDFSGVNYFCFGENDVWLIQDYYHVADLETGETEVYSELQRWSPEGENMATVPLDFMGEDAFLSDMTLGEDGTLLISTVEKMYFLDQQGQVISETETDGAPYEFCRDRDGRLYFLDIFENVVYTVDWTNHTIGEPVLTLDRMGKVYPGGGDYDFLISEELTLRGVSLTTGSITEILSWEDWDLAGSVGGVAYLDEETFLICTMGLLLDVNPVLTLSRVPAGEIPEKEVIRMAVPLSSEMAGVEISWTEVVDQKVAEQMANFNRASATHRIQVETFASATGLNLKFASGDVPDMVYWDYTSRLEENPSAALLAKKGYLEDLEPYFAESQEANLQDFIPNIVELAKERDGGLYAMPMSFYFTCMTAPEEYGDGSLLTVAQMLEAARNLPEGMQLYGFMPQGEALDMLMEGSIQNFVDMQTGECDFCNQDFYDILTIARDYFPAEITEDTIFPSGAQLFCGIGSIGSLGQMASDEIRPLKEQGKKLIGYPGVGGNGLSAIFMGEFSICAHGKNKEVAWDFVESLYSYEFQTVYDSIFISVRDDVFNEAEDLYLQYNGSCTEAESMAIRELIYGIAHVRTLDHPVLPMVREEAEAYFAGDKTAEQVAEILENRVKIYLSEQS